MKIGEHLHCLFYSTLLKGKFMEFMRTNYADLTHTLGKQHFGCTVVAEEAGSGGAEM